MVVGVGVGVGVMVTIMPEEMVVAAMLGLGVVVVGEAVVMTPVQKEPRGQQATLPALSRVQTLSPAQQLEPELRLERPAQEL